MLTILVRSIYLFDPHSPLTTHLAFKKKRKKIQHNTVFIKDFFCNYCMRLCTTVTDIKRYVNRASSFAIRIPPPSELDRIIPLILAKHTIKAIIPSIVPIGRQHNNGSKPVRMLPNTRPRVDERTTEETNADLCGIYDNTYPIISFSINFSFLKLIGRGGWGGNRKKKRIQLPLPKHTDQD